MEKFSKTGEKYFYFHKQNFRKLSEFMEKVIKNKLHKEISWNGPVEDRVIYQATIGGKPLCSSGSPCVKILYLVFKNQTLKKYIDEFAKNSSLLNKDIEDEKIMVNGKDEGITVEDFEDMVLMIKQEITKKQNLLILLEQARKIHKESNDLYNMLNNEKERLRKKLYFKFIEIF